MKHPLVKPRADAPPATVYASLDELIRLQFKAQGFSFLPRQPVHSVLFGRHASRLRGRGLNFEELRNYLPGDDVRSLDWKVTARTRKPHVRVYTEERDRPVWLVVDQRISLFFGSRVRMKSVTAAEATALAAWRSLAGGDRVGALVYDDSDITSMAPQRSRQQVMRILAAVVEKNHALRADSDRESAPEMLNTVLERLIPLAKHDGLICLIGDGTGVDENTRRLITQLTQHNDVLAAFVFDPLEEQLPAIGRLTVSDGSGQLELDTHDRRLREGFATDFQFRLQRMRDISRHHAIPLLPLNTVEPVPEQIRALLGHRAPARRV